MHATICGRPTGEAPEWVRDAWIGVRLPLASRRKRTWFGLGVVSGPHSFLGYLWALVSGRTLRIVGYSVNAKAAVELLAQKNPEAAEWWHQNTPHLLDGRHLFVFDENACRLEGGSTGLLAGFDEKDLGRALERLWARNPPPLSDRGLQAARDLEQLYQLELPEEFKSYLIESSPQTDWMDSNGIVWWAPERMKSLRDECGTETPKDQVNPEIEAEAHQFLVFADYLDWCGYAYAICCSGGPDRGKVAIVGTGPDRFVASSFPTFVRLAAKDSDRLHSPVGDKFTDLV